MSDHDGKIRESGFSAGPHDPDRTVKRSHGGPSNSLALQHSTSRFSQSGTSESPQRRWTGERYDSWKPSIASQNPYKQQSQAKQRATPGSARGHQRQTRAGGDHGRRGGTFTEPRRDVVNNSTARNFTTHSLAQSQKSELSQAMAGKQSSKEQDPTSPSQGLIKGQSGGRNDHNHGVRYTLPFHPMPAMSFSGAGTTRVHDETSLPKHLLKPLLFVPSKDSASYPKSTSTTRKKSLPIPSATQLISNKPHVSLNLPVDRFDAEQARMSTFIPPHTEAIQYGNRERRGDNHIGPIPYLDNDEFSAEQREKLLTLVKCVLPADVIAASPYFTTPFTNQELLAQRRCDQCKKLPRYSGKSLIPPSGEDDGSQMYCKFHPGRVVRMYWTCCNQHVTVPACSGASRHVVAAMSPMELMRQFQLFLTPVLAPDTARPAISIDCEMGTAMNGDRELIRVSVVDVATRQTLLDKLVCPSVPMAHYNTKYSGVSRAQMENAKRNNTCLHGTLAAREAVLQWVGPESIVIGHSVWNDFATLRWIHPRILDTFVLEDKFYRRQQEKWEAMELSMLQRECSQEEMDEEKQKFIPTVIKKGNSKGSGALSLKTASLRRLGREIQCGHGHDSLEDAIATMDVALWHANHPQLSDYIWWAS